jgi:hypothetical protein
MNYKERKQFMKTRKAVFFTTMTLFAALAITVQTSAQSRTGAFDAAAKGTIKTFNAKGAGTGSGQGTYPWMNNQAGAITGYYYDANFLARGFLRAPDGTIKPFDVPGSGTVKGSGQGTYAFGISPWGDITGTYQDENYLYHGYLRDADGAFTTIDSLGAGTEPNQGTFGEAINPAGIIAGEYLDANNAFHGFVRAPDGAITTFDDPKAGTSANQGTHVSTSTGISPKGAIVGWYIDSKEVTHGYLRSPGGSFTRIDGPGAVYTNLADIAPNGTIVGWFQDTNNVNHGLWRSPGGKITQFDDPSAGTGADQGTLGYGINPAGTIVGIYIDASNVSHGFELSGGTFTTIDVPGASGTLPSTINPAGEIVGWYVDKNNAAHGFLWTP